MVCQTKSKGWQRLDILEYYMSYYYTFGMISPLYIRINYRNYTWKNYEEKIFQHEWGIESMISRFHNEYANRYAIRSRHQIVANRLYECFHSSQKIFFLLILQHVISILFNVRLLVSTWVKIYVYRSAMSCRAGAVQHNSLIKSFLFLQIHSFLYGSSSGRIVIHAYVYLFNVTNTS